MYGASSSNKPLPGQQTYLHKRKYAQGGLQVGHTGEVLSYAGHSVHADAYAVPLAASHT